MNGKDIFLGLKYVGEDLVEEAEFDSFPETEKKKRSGIRTMGRKPLMIAALIGLMLFLMGCAWVVMKMQDLKIGHQEVQTEQENIQLEVLSLQGIEGTANYLANQEWLQFESSYVSTPVSGWDSDEAYWAYSVKDQHMVDKIDEICKKYGLNVIGKPWHEHIDCNVFLSLMGIDSLLKSESQAVFHIPQGRFFTGGSFTVYGTLTVPETDASLYVTYHYVKKNVFYDVFAYVTPGTVTEEVYTTEQGVPLLLLQSEKSGMIMADCSDCFISVGVDLNSEVSLKEIAEQFDFTIHSDGMDEQTAADREQASIDEANARYDDKDRYARSTYEEYVQDVLWSEGMFASNTNLDIQRREYCFYDLDGNGVQELLIVYGDRIGNAVSMAHGKTNEGKSYSMVLCEDNVLIDKMDAGESTYYYIFRFRNDGDPVFSNPKEESIVRLKEENGQWWRTSSTDHYADFDVQMTEEEAKDILSAYTVVELDVRPLSQFEEP